MTDNVGENITRHLQVMTEGHNRAQVGRLILFATLWLTLFILAVKVSAAWATRSLSLMAESLQTLLVSFSILLSLLRIAAPDRLKRPSLYGHGKRETIITLLLVAVLGFVGLNLLVMSGQRLLIAVQGRMLVFPVSVSFPLIQLLGVVLVTNVTLALLCLYQARVLGNPTLRFNGGQLLKDVWLTLFIMGELLAVWWGLVWLDEVLAILLLVLAVKNYWQVISWQLPLLVKQTAIAPEVLAQIARQVAGITHCYQIQSQGIVGRFVYIQMRLIVHPEFREVTSLIFKRIEVAIQERYGPVQVTFYLDDDFKEPIILNPSSVSPEVNGKNDHPGKA